MPKDDVEAPTEIPVKKATRPAGTEPAKAEAKLPAREAKPEEKDAGVDPFLAVRTEMERMFQSLLAGRWMTPSNQAFWSGMSGMPGFGGFAPMLRPAIMPTTLLDFWSSFTAPVIPQMDITETAQGYSVTTELPGVKAGDISVRVDGNILSISGEKRYEHGEQDGDRCLTERRFGTFRRTFTMPETINANKIAATFENGLLTVELPKHEDKRSEAGRSIPVKQAA
ncbi:MAG: Hsp20/alpha crystallin family protein [Alphaproteobacteria bacterium]|nr:Hsp20/alpha crystallin family protein [Alphaproteobacteria bacterium]